VFTPIVGQKQEERIQKALRRGLQLETAYWVLLVDAVYFGASSRMFRK